MEGENEVLLVGTTGDYPPFSHTPHIPPPSPSSSPSSSPPLHYEGIDIALSSLLAASMRKSVHFVHTTWRDAADDLLNKKYDIFMGGISITEERRRRGLEFSRCYFRTHKAPIFRVGEWYSGGGSTEEAMALINRPSTRVIVNPGGVNEVFARTHFPLATLTLSPNNPSCFRQIADGNADVMVTDRIECEWLCGTKYQGVLQCGDPFVEYPVEKAFMMRKDDVELKERVDEWIEREQSVIEEVIQRYKSFIFS